MALVMDIARLKIITFRAIKTTSTLIVIFGQPFDDVPGLGFSWAAHSRQPQARGHCTGTPEQVSSSHFYNKDLE
jgi:hypothetical protein